MKTVSTFNCFFYEFIKVAKSITKTSNTEVYNLIRENYVVKDMVTEDHIKYFDSNVTQEVFDDLLQLDIDDIKITENIEKVEVIKGVDMKTLIDDGSTENLSGIYCYLIILTIMQHAYKKELSEESVDTLVSTLSQCQSNLKVIDYDDILDEDLVSLLQKVHDLSKGVDCGDDEEDGGENKGGGKSTFEEKLENSTIGSLAREIAGDIDVSKMDIKNPEDLFSNENSQLIGDIVGKVTSKLHKKMQNGTIRQDQMMSEAMNLFSSMGGLGGMGGGGGGDGAGVGGDMFANMMNTMSKSFSGSHSGAAARTRLSRKYADRKKS
jgi:hypothetical protein